MRLNNPFSLDTRNIFLYVFWCFDCERSDQGLELHHIESRRSDSKVNAIPLCKVCHAKVGHTFDEETRYREITLRFYIRENVRLTQKDIVYLQGVDNLLYIKYAGVIK